MWLYEQNSWFIRHWLHEWNEIMGGGGLCFRHLPTSRLIQINKNLQTTNQIKLTRENLWTPRCIFHDYPPNFVWSMVRYMNITFQDEIIQMGGWAFKIAIDWKKNCYVEMQLQHNLCMWRWHVLSPFHHWSRKIDVGLKPTIEWSWWHQWDWLHHIVELHTTNEFMTVQWYLSNGWN